MGPDGWIWMLTWNQRGKERPTKTVQCFSKTKPWITPYIKSSPEVLTEGLRSRNREELKNVQRELRKRIREGEMATVRRWRNSCQRTT